MTPSLLDDVIDLDALVRPITTVKLFQKQHAVLPIDGNGVNLLDQIAELASGGKKATVTESMAISRKIAQSSIPTLSAEEVQKLTMEQLTAIIGLVTRRVDQVKETVARAEGNAGGAPMLATAASDQSPDQTSSNPSAPSSSA